MEPLLLPRNSGRNLTHRFFGYLNGLRPGDRALLKGSLIALFVFAVWLAASYSTGTQVDVPTPGGSYTEGIVGTPRFVNPVLAVTRADKDMTALIYDGLMRLGAEGQLVPNIAESVTVSEDGLTYNVLLRSNVTFHDGAPLTADDVLFTVSRIQDPALGSPLRSNLEGVAVEQLGAHEVNFVLNDAYAPFIENLTFGILPQHIWRDATPEEFPFSQHNSEPIGSGPYKIKRIVRNTSGIPESYILEPHQEYHLGTPKIEGLVLNFYANEERMIAAFNEATIGGMAGLDHTQLGSAQITEAHTVARTPLPRTFAIFFNQNKSAVLRDETARHALDAVIDREKLVASVLGGYGHPLSSPIPPGFGIEATDVSTSSATGFESARAILRNAGWKVNEETDVWEKTIDETVTPLSFSIATVNNSVFEATAEFLRAEWEKLGAQVTVKQFEQSDLTQAIIRPRDYEALLFGTAVGRALDFYPFWHSSQRNDPGLNVSLYANITTDSILNEARTDTNTENRAAALKKFEAEIIEEVPAIFLYSPELLYVLPAHITGASFGGLTEPSERFSTIHEWFIATDSVWPIFNTVEE